jgi:hypothetical protein
MTTNRQLELGFNGTQTRIFGRQPASRATRAKWWFARMREAVASAMDWPPETAPRPEQVLFSEANRELKA